MKKQWYFVLEKPFRFNQESLQISIVSQVSSKKGLGSGTISLVGWETVNKQFCLFGLNIPSLLPLLSPGRSVAVQFPKRNESSRWGSSGTLSRLTSALQPQTSDMCLTFWAVLKDGGEGLFDLLFYSEMYW